MTPWSAASRDTTRGALARTSSAASGFFFCGMIDEPDAQASDSLQKPNSAEDHSTSSPPRRDGSAVGGVVDARQRPGAERQLACGAEHELEPARVAAKHPEVGQQVVREV